MEYRILRGADQIGGTITEIISEKGTRIWIDFGAELSADKEETSDREMIERMNSENRPEVVFFTHIHGDHIGLLHAVPEDVVIYIGKVGKMLLDNIRMTLKDNVAVPEEERYKLHKEYEILNHRPEGMVRLYKDCKELLTDEYDVFQAKLEEIRFKALRVDHSAFDSYMLQFEIDGKVLVHTGDFRSHGRLGKNLIEDIKTYFCREEKPVDILFVEGTMMSRTGEKIRTEKEMQKEATALLQKHRYAFLVCSSTNMESLASFYWAALHSSPEGKKKALYCNSYVKRQLELFTEIGVVEKLRQFQFYRSYKLEKDLVKVLSNGETQIQHMVDNGFLMMVNPSEYYMDLMEKLKEYIEGDPDSVKEEPVFIYSMWHGYLEKGKPYTHQGMIELRKKAEELGFEFVELHTSGHADPGTIKDVINVLSPREAIVPIHTEKPEAFRKLPGLDENLREKIFICRD